MATKKPSKITTAAAAKREATKARVEAAKAKAEAAKARASVISGGRAAGFFNFIREQGVVGLAIGLAIGTAAGASVKSIVDNLISPLVSLLTQGVELNTLKIVLKEASEGKPEVAIGWGAIVSSLITLTATALIVYFVIKGAKLDKLDKKKD
jgi:large conductance mechanosensitive channel